MKVFLKSIVKSIIITVALAIVNCIILVLSFCIPTQTMRNHVAESVPLIESEAMYLRWNWAYNTTQVDGQSEYDLYGMAINEDAPGSAIERAMFMWYPDGENLPRNEGIAAYAQNKDIHFDQRTYTRYWNGSVIFLKLLLLIFNISDIRMINFLIQIFLLFGVIWLMARQGMDRYIIPFVAGIIIINPFTMALSVKYASEYIPMLLSVLVILVFGNKIDGAKDGWSIMFAVTGSVTAFMCMLSFPVITLGMPLLVLIWRSMGKDALKTTIQMTLSWGIAYAVTWSMKWVIGTLTTSYNFLQDAFSQMFKYQGDNTVDASAIDRIKQTLWCIVNPVYILLFITFVVIIIVVALKRKNNNGYNTSELVMQILAYVVIALLPLGMILGLGNGYAYVHAYMAHRQYAMTVTAGLCIVELIFENLKLKLEGKNGKA